MSTCEKHRCVALQPKLCTYCAIKELLISSEALYEASREIEHYKAYNDTIREDYIDLRRRYTLMHRRAQAAESKVCDKQHEVDNRVFHWKEERYKPQVIETEKWKIRFAKLGDRFNSRGSYLANLKTPVQEAFEHLAAIGEWGLLLFYTRAGLRAGLLKQTQEEMANEHLLRIEEYGPSGNTYTKLRSRVAEGPDAAVSARDSENADS